MQSLINSHSMDLKLEEQDYESEAERDFVTFVTSQSDELWDEWQEIISGEFDVSTITDPIYENLDGDPTKAQALARAYGGDFLSFIRAHNEDVASRMRYLIKEAAKNGFMPSVSLYSGCYPTHCFNAQARIEGKTRLILVHTGFERMLIDGARLLFAIHDKIITEKVERWPEPSWWSRTSIDELTDRFAELMVSFIKNVDPDPVYLNEDDYPFEPEKELPAFSAASSGKDFALCHELGHVFSGHLDKNMAHLRQLRSGLKVLSPEWEEEVQADLFAGRLLFCTPPENEEQNVLDLIYGKYIGVGLFFDMDGLISDIESEFFGLDDDSGTHPPARDRELSLLRSIRPDIKSRSLFLERRIIGRTMKKIRNNVIAKSLYLLERSDHT